MNTEASRAGAVLFEMSSRGTIAVSGNDRERWLGGMVSNDVAALVEDPGRSGCYAALLTPQGRIVADLHVLQRGDCYWLETRRDAVQPVIERLERYVIADDVQLRDASDEHARLALEGARARDVLGALLGRPVAVAPDCVEDAEIDGEAIAVAAFGWSGEEAFQLFAPSAAADRLSRTLLAAEGVVAGTAELLELMRVEAGIPELGAELAEDTLPDEARIGHAICDTKGCYTGQEVIARLRSRGGVKHRLVGLRGRDLPAPGARIERANGKRTGELTSRARSDLVGGEIGLGFVHRDDAEAGTRLICEDREVVVSDLPFVELVASRTQA
ncbi:MAG: glycine cleavage T C-terminal barrel domain-containing protein [Myxococcota bacterium]|nr:glycine cleavage T C-terminal barrel domain-containing protein [Myxococcota bacterium]